MEKCNGQREFQLPILNPAGESGLIWERLVIAYRCLPGRLFLLSKFEKQGAGMFVIWRIEAQLATLGIFWRLLRGFVIRRADEAIG